MYDCLQAQSLLQAESAVVQQRQAYEALDNDLAQALEDLSLLQSKHDAQAQSSSKQILLLEKDIESRKLHITTVESELTGTSAKAKAAEEHVVSLIETIDNLHKQSQTKTEQADSLQSELLAKTSEHDALMDTLHTSTERCQSLSKALQQTEEALKAKCTELGHASERLTSQDAEQVRQSIASAAFCKLCQLACFHACSEGQSCSAT